ncbi:O-phospho-L-seryl-tRNA:Cys-tRNA synthase [Methermicoccus shengliensis]|uniref:O-phospho-L-seryl-tRNA:Cys-tRNA synthase n=1 Tax=Methermicoccus shengliensis TaxID=660064 RepID=A0A832RTC5_9EURY|nr:O-phospho-L-seryl-tRNA:Cys-tRNA synthase [Methermicoccus shengliensis]KUK04559.1 MAG: O-phospho-L-seryl-tRNA:Cys-tRNA synthase [Euryarchaeota archaeon 55_53]KUK29619.1 MAG: O-phospho-L-seryl-tRNA:Cys-tRNA synthase [Methanosarcinales archeaon 56_1174]MDI3487757.1 Sep-tRNA:Cys-tRNA synthetase [Methanosarcinales archaeon]MDN5294887.1 Sep-tRNA:Cys-tRNA synthetase [Methanosarcinales archaeon]HIH70078.1 O-phospho-L-seryl-tRNA:Cys-tRNA synthase [Methermicoccus shengliensis]
MRFERYHPDNLKRPSSGYINIHPIQRGGILTPEARKVLLEWADGYSVCDLCFEGRVDTIKKPPIVEFKQDVAEFLGMDDVRFTAGARHAMFVVMSAFERGEVVVLDSLAHYTSYLAAELSGLKVVEVPNTGYPEFKVDPEAYAMTFERVREEYGKMPALALLTHVDYRYGNVADAKAVGRVCEDYEIPLLLNTAYSSGVMPVDGRKLRATFVVGSGHKSWAATAPMGILATTYEFCEGLFRKSKIRGEWSGRGFFKKEVPLFGCAPVYGLPLITLMASFPRVVERVMHWDEEVEKARYFVAQMEKIVGVHQIGMRPTEHTLNNFETLPFHSIAKKHKRGGYFLYSELKKRGVVGVYPGMTKSFKVNTYGLTNEELEKVIWAFRDIAEKSGLEIES